MLQVQLHSKDSAYGAGRAQQQRRRSLLLQLRCGLASVLRDAVTPHIAAGEAAAAGASGTAGLAAAAGLSSNLLVCVGHQAQTTVDAMGRPTLLLIRDTADQAIEDTKDVAGELEDLLSFLQTPDALLDNAEVARKLADWGPGLSGLNPTTSTTSDAAGAKGAENGAPSMALVVAGEGSAGAGVLAMRSAAAAGASGFGSLDPAPARRLARQCAARAAAGLLGQLSKQLHLVEQCLAIVLLHFVQVSVGQLVHAPPAQGLSARTGAACVIVGTAGAASVVALLAATVGDWCWLAVEGTHHTSSCSAVVNCALFARFSDIALMLTRSTCETCSPAAC